MRHTGQLTALQRCCDSIFVTDGTTSGVHEPGTLLEVFEEVCVHQATGTLVQRAVDGHDVALQMCH